MKVEIRNTDGIGANTKIIDEDGVDLTGLLRPIHISLDVKGLVQARFDVILPGIDLRNVTGKVYATNPKTGQSEVVRAIEFESGQVEL